MLTDNDAHDAYQALDKTITLLQASGVMSATILSALVAQLNNRMLMLDTPEGDVRTAVLRLLRK